MMSFMDEQQQHGEPARSLPCTDGFTTRSLGVCGDVHRARRTIAVCTRCTWIAAGSKPAVEMAKRAHRLWSHTEQRWIC